jgi:hypothetical protein
MLGNGTSQLGVNLAYTKFLFIAPANGDDAARTRLRAAVSMASRGFFNDFEAERVRDPLSQEAIQYLINEDNVGRGIAGARYVLQISSKYRPRLQETEAELRRRLSDLAEVTALDGAVRVPQYTSAEMHEHAFKHAVPRMSGRFHPNVIILPIRKSAAWWQKPALERQVYFYPHADLQTGTCVKGHALAAEAGIRTIHRRLYYNPDGHGRAGEFDFITYFECADEHVATFDQVCRELRDEHKNPEWRFVMEGPEWRGRRVVKW